MKNNESGQALFEFIAFFPFMIIFFMLIFSVNNAINGSINQQKIARAYFFSRIKGDSNMPPARSLEAGSWTEIYGMFFIGYAEKTQAQQPFASCYGVFGLRGGDASEGECDEELPPAQTSVKYIKPQTAFGACGETYVKVAEGQFDQHLTRANASSCIIR